MEKPRVFLHPGLMAEKQPHKTAVVMADGSSSMTFEEFEQMSNRMANALRAHGAQPEDKLAILPSTSSVI
jgi:acyl-coenzyme A synthetase/AMP-(fatty) acid ligase